MLLSIIRVLFIYSHKAHFSIMWKLSLSIIPNISTKLILALHPLPQLLLSTSLRFNQTNAAQTLLGKTFIRFREDVSDSISLNNIDYKIPIKTTQFKLFKMHKFLLALNLMKKDFFLTLIMFITPNVLYCCNIMSCGLFKDNDRSPT